MKQKLGRKQSFASVIILLVMMLCGQSASAKLGYTPLRGTMGYPGGYDYDKMFDGDVGTKWCSASNHEGWDNGWWVIFKTSKAFSPTSYQIITADDTNSHSERNWKTWRIYGAP